MGFILTNANIVTMDENNTRASALAVQWDKILAVGQNAEILAGAHPHDRTIDVGGKTVLPGFIDTHNHLSFYGYLVSSVDCRAASGAESIGDIIDRLRAEADKKPPGEWVMGWGYAHYHLKENRPITREDLDKVSAKHPVLIIQVSGHAGVANSAALQRFDYTKDTPDPVGGSIRRDPRSGEPNGILEESALMNQVQAIFFQHFSAWSLEQKMQTIQTAVTHYNRAGITSLHEAYVLPQTLHLYQEMDRRDRLNVRVYAMVIDFSAPALLDAGVTCGYGTPMVRVGPVKMFMDGGMSNRTAAVSRPYANSDETGIFLSTREDTFAKIERFHNAGYQIAIHAQGDAAIQIVLDAFENVLGPTSENPLRHRIEHCGNITDGQIVRAANLNILVSSQPMFFSHVGDAFLDAFGADRGHRLYPYRSLMNHGIRVAGASDSPVAPAAPLVGIRDAVLRLTGSGKEFGPEERLSLDEAVRLYTSEASYFSFDEKRLGTIEPGKYADFVILDRDITTLPAAEVVDAEVLMTVVGGRTVYEK